MTTATQIEGYAKEITKESSIVYPALDVITPEPMSINRKIRISTLTSIASSSRSVTEDTLLALQIKLNRKKVKIKNGYKKKTSQKHAKVKFVKDRKRRDRLAKSLCKGKPCRNLAKCQVTYEANKPYECICKIGYSGRHCSCLYEGQHIAGPANSGIVEGILI